MGAVPIGGNYKNVSARMTARLQSLQRLLAYYGFRMTVLSGRRSLLEQIGKIRQGHSTVLRSKHLEGDAADLEITPRLRNNAQYRLAGYFWERLGGKWGGNFKDPKLAAVEFQHFED